MPNAKPNKVAAKTAGKIAANAAGKITVAPKRPAAGKRAIRPRPAAEVQTIFTRFRERVAEPKGELEHVNAFTLLVAVVLSAQATDAGVNKATRALFARVTMPEQMLALGEEGLIQHIKSIGLFRGKAKNVIALSQLLIERHGGEVPATRAELEALPGVGRKTANVVLNMWFGQITHAVDTHVFRVANRLRLAPGKTPLAVELGLERAIPDEFGHHAHHWLILHGRYVCKAQRPDCAACLVNDLCDSPDKRA